VADHFLTARAWWQLAGPPGASSNGFNENLALFSAGKCAMWIDATVAASFVTNPKDSKVADKVGFALAPNTGLGKNANWLWAWNLAIPAGSKKKEAAWEFIKWALSKETIGRIVAAHGYPSVCRRSIIVSEKFREVLTLNGQDVASLYLQVLELGGKGGYMKYRTVPVYPQVGDKINKAIERIATKQQAAPEAMKQAQGEAIQDLQKAGFKVDG